MKVSNVVSNVPIATTKRSPKVTKYSVLPLEFMKVGDSFTCTVDSDIKPTRERNAVTILGDRLSQYLYKYCKKINKAFTIRTENSTTVRIWRVL